MTFRKVKSTLLTAGVLSLASYSAAANPSVQAFDMHRCVNMGNSLENSIEGKWGGGPNIAPSDFKKIREKGFDTVRIPVRWDDYAGGEPDYIIDPKFVDRVKSIVDSALAQDLNVILNIHHFHEIMDEPETEMLQFVNLWIQISEIFKDYPDDLWFETLNEPSKKLTGELMQLSQTLAVQTIRENNPDRLIILGGEFWSGFRQLDTNIAPPDDNIIYTFHYYEPFEFTHYLAEWTKPNMPDKLRSWGSTQDKADLSAAVNSVKTYRDQIGRPVFLGEFGVYTTIKNKDRVKWLKHVRQEMEAAEIPWCLWAYANTFPVYNPDKKKWDKKALSALGLK
jgi:endoglucanase